ncbi:phasin family protein [Paroceanicella profunda]|nr:phasin family protein [Paroceanicella profunda]
MPSSKPTPEQAYAFEKHFSITPFLEAQQRALRATLDLQSQALARASRMSSTCADFIRMRLEEDRKALVEGSGCRTPQEALTLSTAFMETAVKQYGEEFASLTRLCIESLHDTVQAVPELAPVPAMDAPKLSVPARAA